MMSADWMVVLVVMSADQLVVLLGYLSADQLVVLVLMLVEN